jgi:hypothetical protein
MPEAAEGWAMAEEIGSMTMIERSRYRGGLEA